MHMWAHSICACAECKVQKKFLNFFGLEFELHFMELHSACTEIKINTMKNAECMMLSTISITVSDIMIVLVSIIMFLAF